MASRGVGQQAKREVGRRGSSIAKCRSMCRNFTVICLVIASSNTCNTFASLNPSTSHSPISHLFPCLPSLSLPLSHWGVALRLFNFTRCATKREKFSRHWGNNNNSNNTNNIKPRQPLQNDARVCHMRQQLTLFSALSRFLSLSHSLWLPSRSPCVSLPHSLTFFRCVFSPICLSCNCNCDTCKRTTTATTTCNMWRPFG